MKTLAELKRTITVGTKLLVIEHLYRPELIGTVRTVTSTQTNGYWFDSGDGKRAWSAYAKASCYSFPDANTYTQDEGAKANGKTARWTLQVLT